MRRSKHKRYGFWDFAIDMISLPISLGIYVLDKTLSACGKAIDSISG
jgi:hypothetical protein